jgi:hypothetical protein
MPYPSASDTARIEARIARMLTDRCDLYDAARPRAAQVANVPCQVVPLAQPVLAATGDRAEVFVAWRILLPVGTDVQPDWQVRLRADTATPSLRERVFTVTGDLAGSDERVRKVAATEAQ